MAAIIYSPMAAVTPLSGDLILILLPYHLAE
jgi:hypothetical protein